MSMVLSEELVATQDAAKKLLQAKSPVTALRTLRDELQAANPQLEWPELSMGMTNDFVVAIEIFVMHVVMADSDDARMRHLYSVNKSP